ncbi:sigma-70 family RNA polymerase sigma factor [Sneathiella sp.]|uniref:sigma-70 family RNA polymerase sigma factor n=1 Tax=Sneathiella sp. TaxID=1964365 RepID=UPI0039E5CFE9
MGQPNRTVSIDDMKRGTMANNATPNDLNEDLTAIAHFQDQKAYHRLFHSIAPRLKSFLLSQGVMENNAEEILQETMLKVWQKARLFDSSKASASTWIYTIARNVKIDRIRKDLRPEPDPHDPSYIPDSPETGEQSISRKQEGNVIRKAVAKLPPEQIRIITMSFYEDKSHAEIAEALNLPLGTVKSRIRLAFGKIRNELDGVS